MKILASSRPNPIDDCVELVQLLSKAEQLCKYLYTEYADDASVFKFFEQCSTDVDSASYEASRALLTLTGQAD